jgi:hypothetical protein
MAKQSTKAKKKLPSQIILIIFVGIIAGMGIGYFFGSHRDWREEDGNDDNVQQNHFINRSNKMDGCSALQITSPQKGQQATSPLTVTAIVDNTNHKCHWTVFEAQAGSIEVRNSKGQVIGKGKLTTQAAWMNEQPVTYTGTVTFNSAEATPSLTLVINEENPSGQPGQQINFPLNY